jgi:cysteine desulfurase
MSHIYFDHNASTPVYPEAFDEMIPFLRDDFGNSSSIHWYGQRAKKAVEQARERMAKFINAESPDEIIFTSGGTESNNTAIKGAFGGTNQPGKRFVTSAIEHSAVRHVTKHLAEMRGADNVVVPVQPNGIVKLSDVDEAITPDTILCTIMAVNNEIGTIQPVQEIAKICRKKNVPFHTDAVQAAGKIPVDVQAWGVDMLSLSGHKIGGPKGVGILYVRKGTRLTSLIQGGTQQKNRRGGTENVAGCVGMAVAADITAKNFKEEVARLHKMRDHFEKTILSQIPSTFVNGDVQNRSGNTSNIGFEYTDSSELVMALDLKGIAVSNGSACAAGNPEPSHVLLALGLPQDKAHASIRFSFGHTTTDDEIAKAIPIIKETVERVRQNHPLWKKASGQ